MIRSLVARIAVLLVVLLAVFGVEAQAYQLSTFRLRIEDPTTGVGRVLTDNVTLGLANLNGDESSAAGTIYFQGYIENFFVSIQATSSTVNSNGTGGGVLSLGARVSYSQATQGSLMISLEDTGYTPPAPPVTFTGTVGGYDYTAKALTPTGDLTGSAASLSVQSWLDSANNAPAFGANTGSATLAAMTVPVNDGASTTAFASPDVFNTTGFSQSSTPVAVASSGASYSIFSQATVNFSGAGAADFSLTASDPGPSNGGGPSVPEPTSLLLLGSALFGLGVLGRKKQV